MHRRLAADAPPLTALLDRVARRDAAALTELVEAYDKQMVRLCYLITTDVELARDATQTAWYRLWSRPPRLRDEQRLRSWLLSVAANEARQQLRRRARRRLREIAASDRGQRAEAPDAATRIDVSRALARLEPRDRELLALRFALGMSSSEIGDHLGLSAEGARTRLHRLLARLRKELRDD